MSNYKFGDAVKFTGSRTTDFDDIVKDENSYGIWLCKEQGYNFVAYNSGDVFGIEDKELQKVETVKPRTKEEIKSDHEQLKMFTELVKEEVDVTKLNELDDDALMDQIPDARIKLIQYAKAFSEAKKWFEEQAKMGHIDESKIRTLNSVVNDEETIFV